MIQTQLFVTTKSVGEMNELQQYIATWMNIKNIILGFPGGTVVENLPANAGDTGSSPGLGRSHMPWSN